MQPKIIILNAPPQSGKDTAANYLAKHLDGQHMSFKRPLHDITVKMLGLDMGIYLDAYEEMKEVKMIDIGGDILFKLGISYMKHLTLREWYIHLSENVLKPSFGDDFFGVMAAKRLKTYKWNIFSDGGFSEEIKALYSATPKENITVIKIQQNFKNFKNDSRGWISEGLVGKTIVIENNDSLADFYKQLDVIIGGLT